MNCAQKPRRQSARTGGRRVEHNDKLPKLPFLGVFQRLDQRHSVVVLHAVGVPRIRKIRVAHMAVLPHSGKLPQQRGKARLIFRNVLHAQALMRRPGADLWPLWLHIRPEPFALPLPERRKPFALAGASVCLPLDCRLLPEGVAVALEGGGQLLRAHREVQPQLVIDRRCGKCRSVFAGVKRPSGGALQRKAQQPQAQKLRAHVARQRPARRVPVSTGQPRMTQHRVKDAVQQHLFRVSGRFHRRMQPRFRRIEKCSVRSRRTPLPPFEQAQRQRQQRQALIKPTAQDLIAAFAVRHAPTSRCRTLRNSIAPSPAIPKEKLRPQRHRQRISACMRPLRSCIMLPVRANAHAHAWAFCIFTEAP